MLGQIQLPCLLIQNEALFKGFCCDFIYRTYVRAYLEFPMTRFIQRSFPGLHMFSSIGLEIN